MRWGDVRPGMMLLDTGGGYHRFIIGVSCISDDVRTSMCRQPSDPYGRKSERVLGEAFVGVTVSFMEIWSSGEVIFGEHGYAIDDHVEDYGEEVVVDGVRSLRDLGGRPAGRRAKGEG